MTSARPQSVKDLFDIHGQIVQDILKLQSVCLPQPKLIMLYERAAELRTALEASQSRVAGPREPAGDVSRRQAVQDMCVLLDGLCKKTADELHAAEQQLSYVQFPLNLARYKKEARDLVARMMTSIEREDEATILKRFSPPLSAIATALKHINEVVTGLNARLAPHLTTSLRNMDKIFCMLDKLPTLTSTWRHAQSMLSASAYRRLKDFYLFSSQFYADQLLDNERGLDDLLAHYLAQQERHAPHPFFSPDSYKKSYPEVNQLRYSALEHFARYGEVMHYSPGPDFDTAYYLANNEDVLDANVPPLRHFLNHGLQEGRPPCLKAGGFSINRYLQPTAIRLGFVGNPEESIRSGWNQLRSHCVRRKDGYAEDIPAEAWSGREPVDAFVIGTEGASLLHGDLLIVVAESGCRVLYLGEHPQKDLEELHSQNVLSLDRLCAITPHYERFLRWQESDRPLKLCYYDFNDPAQDIPLVEALLNRLAENRGFDPRRIGQWGLAKDDGPVISVVSIIYKKSKEMKAFLEALNRQDLARPYEVVLVDDASPDDSVERIEEWLEEKRSAGLLNAFMTVRILRNLTNSGNCTSRNRGIEAARASIVLVADGDVVLSTSSLSEHLWAYRQGDCDAVIGFFRFNLDYSSVFNWLAACEINDDIVQQSILRPEEFSFERVQMRQLPNSIFNFVTRNTSFRKSAFDGYYFDESFNYSSGGDSGYGEEDHEIAARLYFNSKKVRFLKSSIAVHMRHGDNSSNTDKVIANLRNWNRLLEKYPDLALVDRQYYQWRTRDLLAKTASRTGTPEVDAASMRYSDPRRKNVIIPPSRPLRILTCMWHAPQQYELFKLVHQFTLVSNIGAPYHDQWNHARRPMPQNARFMNIEQIDPQAFDLAILPFDESILIPGNCNSGQTSRQCAFRSMLEITKNLPRIAQYQKIASCNELSAQQDDGDNRIPTEIQREELRSLLQDIYVVFNSYQEQHEWNFANSSVIWQGFSPHEFPAGSHAKICFQIPYDTAAISYSKQIVQYLPMKNIIEDMDSSALHPARDIGQQDRAVAEFQNYVERIGAFKMCLTSSKHFPMPHTRGESMLTGVIPITIRNKDVEMFITNKINGFYGDSPEELAEYILWTINNEQIQKKISMNTRNMALDIFNVDRYISKWASLINSHT